MNRKVLTGVLIIVIIALGVFFYGTSLTRKATVNEKLKIGVLEHSAGLPYFVALENKYFEQEGLNENNVEYVSFTSSKPLGDAIASGGVDVGIISYATIFGWEARTPGEFTGLLPAGDTLEHGTLPLLVPKDSQINSITDLKGKKIGIAGPSVIPFVKIIIGKFFDTNQVEFVNVDTTVQVQALATKNLDALLATEPHATIALESGIARVLEPSPRAKYIMNPFPAGPLMTVKLETAKQKHSKIEAAKRALERAIEHIRLNESSAREIMAKRLKLNQSIAKKAGLYVYYTQSEVTPEIKQRVQELADVTFKANQTSKLVDTRTLFYSD